jgi:anti-anti-sigma regulatory factor
VAGVLDIAQLQSGDHACLTFTDHEERLDLVATFVREGLKAGQRVVCVTDLLTDVALSGELIDRGLEVDDAVTQHQLRIVAGTDWFLADSAFDSAIMLDRVDGQIQAAVQDGFAGLWITSDMHWATRPAPGVENLFAYESRIGTLIRAGGGVAVCQYDRQCFDNVTLTSVAASHERAVAAATYHDDALLRICRQYQPPGIRVSGEIDYRQIEPLTQALTEAFALDDVLAVNLSGLMFIDGSAAGAILQAATGLRPGQRMRVRCRPQAGKLLAMLGLAELPGVDMVVIDDQ